MKIYSNTITHAVEDMVENTTDYIVYTLATMWGETITYEPTMVDSGTVDDNGNAIMIQDTDSEGNLLYTTITTPYIKEGVVEFNASLGKIGRDEYEMSLSTYWEDENGNASLGICMMQDKYMQNIDDHNNHGMCCDKFKEIKSKQKTQDLEDELVIEREARATHSTAILSLATKILALEEV